MNVKIFKNFLTKEECNVLNEITKQGIEDGWIYKGFQKPNFNYSLRYTSRMHMGNHEYPDFVKSISNKIRSFLKIDSYPLILGHGKDGVVVSITFKGGSVYKHKDPRSDDDLITYRCNILTQANEDGCELYVGGEKININVGDLHCYMASEIEHYVTEAKGETPRIMWMFGCHLPLNDLDKIQ